MTENAGGSKSIAGKVAVAVWLWLVSLWKTGSNTFSWRKSFGTVAGITGIGWMLTVSLAVTVTPIQSRNGWAGPAEVAKPEARALRESMPKFRVMSATGQEVKVAGIYADLWKYARTLNGGKHWPNIAQETGDCVSWGSANAVLYRMCFQIAKDLQDAEVRRPFPPFIYGTSRHNIGKDSLGRGAGSMGVWAADAVKKYGIYSWDQAKADGFTYSGTLADKWGSRTGPPQVAYDFAQDFKIRTTSQIKSWSELVNAIGNGYPVTVASNQGFQMQQQRRQEKMWGVPHGEWGHQMCFIGVEDRPGKEKGAYVLNSWGSSAHSPPAGDEPPGGFWVTAPVTERMLRANDSFAYSDFDGFQAEDLEWNVFKSRVSEEAPAMAQDAENAEEPETFVEARAREGMMQGQGTFGAMMLLVVGLGFHLWETKRHNHWLAKKLTGGTTAAMLAIGFLLLGGSVGRADESPVPPQWNPFEASVEVEIEPSKFKAPPESVEPSEFNIMQASPTLLASRPRKMNPSVLPAGAVADPSQKGADKPLHPSEFNIMALTDDTPKTEEDVLRVGTLYTYTQLMVRSDSFVLQVGSQQDASAKDVSTLAGTPYAILPACTGFGPGLYHIYTGKDGVKKTFQFRADNVQAVRTMLAQPAATQQGAAPRYRMECDGKRCRLVRMK